MANKIGHGQAGVSYPWERWLKKRRIRLYYGQDFDCLPHSMAQQLRNAAFRYKYKVSIRILEDGLTATSHKM